MAIHTSIVDLDSIFVEDDEFSGSEHNNAIEALAYSIIELRDLIEFPVVQMTGVDAYQLLDGHLAYYAYCKACELEPSVPDRLTVFVVTAQNCEAFLNQRNIANQVDIASVTATSSTDDLAIGNLAKSFSQFTSIQQRAMEQLKKDILQGIETKLPRPLPLIEALNRVNEPNVAVNIQKRIEFIGKGKAKKFIELLQEAKYEGVEFSCFADILDSLHYETTTKRGMKRKQRVVSESKMLEIIDQWPD